MGAACCAATCPMLRRQLPVLCSKTAPYNQVRAHRVIHMRIIFRSQLSALRPLQRSAALLVSIFLPWALALGSHAALGRWLPGQVPTPAWAYFASSAFLLGAASAVGLVASSKLHIAVRVVLAALLGVGGLWLSLVFQSRSNCGDYQPYVGKVAVEAVASCS